jgi:hypothetical protein
MFCLQLLRPTDQLYWHDSNVRFCYGLSAWCSFRENLCVDQEPEHSAEVFVNMFWLAQNFQRQLWMVLDDSANDDDLCLTAHILMMCVPVFTYWWWCASLCSHTEDISVASAQILRMVRVPLLTYWRYFCLILCMFWCREWRKVCYVVTLSCTIDVQLIFALCVILVTDYLIVLWVLHSK